MHEFTASLLTSNRAMLELFARLGRVDVQHDTGTTAQLNVCLSTLADDRLREALRAAAAGLGGAGVR